MAKSPIYFAPPPSSSLSEKVKVKMEEEKHERNPFEEYPVSHEKTPRSSLENINRTVVVSFYENDEQDYIQNKLMDKETAYKLKKIESEQKKKSKNVANRPMNVEETKISQLLMDAVRQNNWNQEKSEPEDVDKQKILDSVKRTLMVQGIDFDEDLLESHWAEVTQKELEKPQRIGALKEKSGFCSEVKKMKRMVFSGSSSSLKLLELYCEKPTAENYTPVTALDLQMELEKEIKRKYVACAIQILLLMAVVGVVFGLMGGYFQGILSKTWSWQSFLTTLLYGAFSMSGFAGGNIYATWTKTKRAKGILDKLKSGSWDEDVQRWFAARCLSTDMHYENSRPFRADYKCLMLHKDEGLKNFYNKNKKECAIKEKKLFKQLIKIMDRYAEPKNIHVLERWLKQGPEKIMWCDLQEIWRFDKNLSEVCSPSFKEEYLDLLELADEAWSRDSWAGGEPSPSPSRLVNLF